MILPVAAFKLSKWYLDCVTDRGDVAIAYTGKVHWGMFHLHYSSLLESAAGRIAARYSLRKQRDPEVQGASLCWRADALNMDGEWQADAIALRDTIYSSEDGSIEWHCLMPRANTRFDHVVGLGYAERLTMTVPPWKLPIQALRWGRFTSPSEWIVWIDWQGAFSRRIVYRNGKESPVKVVEDDRIEFEDGARLHMDRSLVIREGPLGTTALSVIPGLKKTFPARLLEIDECKWRSRAHLERRGSLNTEGWAIHERVTWPK
jgi:hypothetical protein